MMLPLPVAVVLGLALQAPTPVAYEISFPNAVHHEAEITVSFTDLPSGPLQVRMSRSSPGRYAIHEFAKNVYSVRAQDSQGKELRISRPDPYGWDVAGHDGTVVISYTLFADHADGTYSGIDETHAHLNMPATFMWARGLGDRPIRVTFNSPRGANWRAATQLAPTDDPLTFTAHDLDYFLDSPTELSDFVLREWQVTDLRDTYTIRVAMHSRGPETALDEYVEWTKRLVEESLGVFGEYPRFDYGTYTFIADYLPWVYGDGMEHRNSTILASQRTLGSGATGFLGTVAHEFFHAWNVERIRPRSLEPFDFERANLSGELWFAEGFTSYYGALLMRRAGLRDDGELARRLSDIVSTVMLSPARGYHGPIGMSSQAPFHDEARHVDVTNKDNTFISYYTWGAALALALDLTLRTEQNTDLDAYMRAVWAQYGAPEIPYTLADLERLLAEVARDAVFALQFFRDYVYGRKAPDFETLLERAGLALRPANPGQATFGWAAFQYSERGARVTAPTLIGTPLYEAGVDHRDVITVLDGRRLTSQEVLQQVMEAHEPGDTIGIEFESRGSVRQAAVTLVENRWLRVVLFEDLGLPLNADQRDLRNSWLGSKVQ